MYIYIHLLKVIHLYFMTTRPLTRSLLKEGFTGTWNSWSSVVLYCFWFKEHFFCPRAAQEKWSFGVTQISIVVVLLSYLGILFFHISGRIGSASLLLDSCLEIICEICGGILRCWKSVHLLYMTLHSHGGWSSDSKSKSEDCAWTHQLFALFFTYLCFSLICQMACA